MTDQPPNLVLEQLRAIRDDLGTIKETLADHSRQFLRVREDKATSCATTSNFHVSTHGLNGSRNG